MAQLTQILNIAADEKLHLFIYGLNTYSGSAIYAPIPNL